jgi:hypothetical protein
MQLEFRGKVQAREINVEVISIQRVFKAVRMAEIIGWSTWIEQTSDLSTGSGK